MDHKLLISNQLVGQHKGVDMVLMVELVVLVDLVVVVLLVQMVGIVHFLMLMEMVSGFLTQQDKLQQFIVMDIGVLGKDTLLLQYQKMIWKEDILDVVGTKAVVVLVVMVYHKIKVVLECYYLVPSEVEILVFLVIFRMEVFQVQETL
tara:strand:- start:40 stop:483 length:444 start_codon:yes stop_codon:yes gene_type:complete